MAMRIWGNRRRRLLRRLFSRAMVLAFILFLCWGGGLIWFAETMPDKVENPDGKTDVIVVLTGGSGRLDEGLRLFDAGLAKKVFVSGLYQGLDVAALLNLSRRSPRSLDCCLGIGYAVDTIDNARETTEWMKKQAMTSARLVTAAYHMRRAVMEFESADPDIEVIPHPVFPGHVKQDRWWAWPGTSGLIIGEYNKYLMAGIRIHLMGLYHRLAGLGAVE